MTRKFNKLVAELKMPSRQSEKSFLNISPLAGKLKDKKKKRKKENATGADILTGRVQHDGPPPGSTPATGLGA